MPRNQFMNNEGGEEVDEETEETPQIGTELHRLIEEFHEAQTSRYVTDDHLEALRQKRMQDLLNESYNSEERVVD